MSIRVEPIPTLPGMGRSLIEHDERSRAFPATALLRAGAPRNNKTWRRPGPYDQANTSTCVGQTFRGMLNTTPNTSLLKTFIRSRYDAYTIYNGAQANDEWPGAEPTYAGSSALGACRYLQGQGIINEYRWCFSTDDVIDTLVQHGPVGIGINWTNDMFKPDADGFITPTGRAAGGHEVEIHGVQIKDEYVIGTNSWGVNWGQRGRFKLRWTDLDKLLQAGGDAATIVSLKG